MNNMSQSINLNSIKELLKQHGQEHLLKYANELSYDELLKLTMQINEIDWSIFAKNEKAEASSFFIEPIHVPSDMKEKEELHHAIGLNAIREG